MNNFVEAPSIESKLKQLKDLKHMHLYPYDINLFHMMCAEESAESSGIDILVKDKVTFMSDIAGNTPLHYLLQGEKNLDLIDAVFRNSDEIFPRVSEKTFATFSDRSEDVHIIAPNASEAHHQSLKNTNVRDRSKSVIQITHNQNHPNKEHEMISKEGREIEAARNFISHCIDTQSPQLHLFIKHWMTKPQLSNSAIQDTINSTKTANQLKDTKKQPATDANMVNNEPSREEKNQYLKKNDRLPIVGNLPEDGALLKLNPYQYFDLDSLEKTVSGKGTKSLISFLVLRFETSILIRLKIFSCWNHFRDAPPII